MGRIRTVKPEFFKHEDLYDAEIESGLPLRVAFEGLWCQADREGRFEWRPRRLKTEILPYDEVDFEDVLQALASSGFILSYEIDGKVYGCIPSFLEHQRPNAHEPPSAIPAPQSTCMHMHACATPNNAHAEPNNALREGEREMSSTHTSAGAREDDEETGDSPPPSPPATDAGGESTRTDEEATDGPPHQTATISVSEMAAIAKDEVAAWNQDFPETTKGLRDELMDQNALLQLQRQEGKTAADFARWRRWLKDERKVPRYHTRPRQYLQVNPGGQEKWAVIEAQIEAQERGRSEAVASAPKDSVHAPAWRPD